MAWEVRRGKRVYYRKVREGGRVRSIYCGPGERGEAAAREDAARRDAKTSPGAEPVERADSSPVAHAGALLPVDVAHGEGSLENLNKTAHAEQAGTGGDALQRLLETVRVARERMERERRTVQITTFKQRFGRGARIR